MSTKNEFKKFDGVLRSLLNVTHDEIKTKLDEEKAAKKRKKPKKTSASGRVGA
jgi:hypothetical protein